MRSLLPQRRARQPQSGAGLSPLAKSLGFTYGWVWSNGVPMPMDTIGQRQAFVASTQAASVGASGGKALAFNVVGGRLEISGNPFATSTCTYLWVESGVDATGPGQSLIESRYSSSPASETGSLQIRLSGRDILIIKAQTAGILTATGGRRNEGSVNAGAVSVAGNNGRHTIFSNGRLAASTTPTVSYVHGTSAIGGGSDCPIGSVEIYMMLFAPVVIPDAILADLTANPLKLYAAEPGTPYLEETTGGPQSYSYTPTGGLVFSGAASVVKSASFQPVGGLNISGAAPAARGAARATSGGLVLSGAATALRGRAVVPAGGVLFAGTAPYVPSSSNQTLTVTPTGGIVFAGASGVLRSMRYTPVGGVTFGGVAGYTNSGMPAASTFSFKRRRILRRHFTP